MLRSKTVYFLTMTLSKVASFKSKRLLYTTNDILTANDVKTLYPFRFRANGCRNTRLTRSA